jgi:hypothetical protein
MQRLTRLVYCRLCEEEHPYQLEYTAQNRGTYHLYGHDAVQSDTAVYRRFGRVRYLLSASKIKNRESHSPQFFKR